jgi:flagellar biosynthesis protein FliR
LSLIMFPFIESQSAALPRDVFNSTIGIFVIVFKEAMVGFVMGFVAKMFFEALSFAFTYIGMQMGFAMASAYDHHTEANTPIVGQFIMILATLLFLAFDGHHMLIRGMMESFHVVPVGTAAISKQMILYIMETGGQVFWIAVKLSAPMALVIFLINVGFGIIAKAVPQINVLVVSFTVNILAGFCVIVLTLPVLGVNVNEVFQIMFFRMFEVLKYMS